MRLGKRKTVCSIVLMAGMPLAMPGCQSSRGVQVVGEDQLVTTYDINIQDWENAADDLSQSLIGAGILGREGRPSVIVFSSFNNATGVSVDRDRLIKKIRVALNRSGTAQVTAVEAVGGVVENEHAESRVDTQNERDQVEDFLRGQESNAPRQPESEYSLSVKLLKDIQRDGQVQQVVYTFQMSLTDHRSGLVLWEDERRIIKQGGRAGSVGW